MDLDDICPIVDSITDLPHYDKRGALHDLALLAAHSLSIDEAIVFNALLKRGATLTFLSLLREGLECDDDHSECKVSNPAAPASQSSLHRYTCEGA
jgi:hypothetical protein